MSKSNMGKHVNLQRGIYILPSLFTTAGLFAGFYALIGAVQGRFELAAWAIVAAAIFDMMDGRVARLLNAETAFGAEYDSLCDMLSFGIAPAVLVYMWALAPLGKPGWLAAFLIAACSALRLARFNVQVGIQDKRYFQGLPTPATALLLASAVLYHEQGNIVPIPWFWWIISVALALLMVSGVRFISGKNIDLRKKRGQSVLVMFVLAIALIMLDPTRILFAIFMAYVLHGPMLSIWQHRKVSHYRIARRLKRKRQERQSRTQQPEDSE